MPNIGELEQLVLLAVLQLGDEAYGVTIQRLLRDRARRALAMATVYTTLDRLEQKGLLTARLGDPTAERGGRRKKFFRVSATGQRAVKTSLAAVVALTRGLDKSFQP